MAARMNPRNPQPMDDDTNGTPLNDGTASPTVDNTAARVVRRTNAPPNNMRPVDEVVTPMTTTTTAMNASPAPAAAAPADSVRWGTIWAGLFTALTVFLVLEMLAAGFGLFNTGANHGPSSLTAWITGVIALIAFFVGGLISESASSIRGSSAGVINGFLVWALGITLIIVFSLFGLSQLFGAVGSVIGTYLGAGRTITAPGVNPTQVVSITQSAAWGAFATLVLTAICAMLGGWLGSSGNSPFGRLVRR